MMLTFPQYGHLLLWIAVPTLTIICVECARLADYYSSSVRKKKTVVDVVAIGSLVVKAIYDLVLF